MYEPINRRHAWSTLLQIVQGFLWISVIALPIVACTGPTGLPGSKQLDELDADERAEACENLADYFDEGIGEERRKKRFCIHVGAQYGDVAECEVAYETCLMEPYSSEVSCALSGPTSCTATVEELEACFAEEIDTTIAFIDGLTCQAVLDGVEYDAFGGPACLTFEQKCPG